MKKRVSVLLAFAVVLFFAFTASAYSQGKANFAGTWSYNASKSDQPQGGGMRGGFGGGDFVAKQEANLLTVERTMTNREGQSVTNTARYTLDGKESVNAGMGGRGESKSKAVWSADGKTLTITTTRTFNENTVTSKEVWQLLSPASLQITTTSNTPNGEVTMKRVYDKK